MALAIAFDDAKKNQIRIEPDNKRGGGGISNVPFIGSIGPDAIYELPQACLSQGDPGRSSSTHFHVVDQFQVVVGGKGTLGRHALAPYTVHFARAYTPYGPLASDADTGVTYFVIRARSDQGAQRLPEKKDKLRALPDRQPWQISRSVTFPALPSGTAPADVMLQAIPGMKDENGLAAYTLSMKPYAQSYAPDPADGDGQYLVVLEGSLLHDNKEHKAWALTFIEPKEGRFQIHAGPQGLAALVLNFPQRKPRAVDPKTPSAAPGFKKWQCALCAFAYDEALGLPEEGIPAGTRWQDVPDTWTCPDCSASKSDFQMVEV